MTQRPWGSCELGISDQLVSPRTLELPGVSSLIRLEPPLGLSHDSFMVGSQANSCWPRSSSEGLSANDGVCPQAVASPPRTVPGPPGSFLAILGQEGPSLGVDSDSCV